MSASSPHRAALDALARFLVTDATKGETLHAVATIAVEAMPNAVMAGISMHDEHAEPATRVFTDQLAVTVDTAQYDTGRGPCLDAWRTGHAIRIDDIAASNDYPEFGDACGEHGIASTLSLPVPGPNGSLAALNLYAKQLGGFSDADESTGSELAAAIGVVLTNSGAYWDAFELSEQLGEAMESRATIEQAKGILMARSSSLTPDEAFEMLAHASRRENVKLREIARRLVERDTPRR